MSLLKFLTITKKFLIPLICITVGFALYGLYSFKILNELKVNGPVYEKIILGKDLVADILPPPDYIVESYLLVYRLRENINDKKVTSELSEQLIKKLKNEYFKRHEFWKKDDCYLTEIEEARKELLIESFKPVSEFFDVVETKYLPAIEEMNTVEATEILNRQLNPLYEEHRKHIDEVVRLANIKNAEIEKFASQLTVSKTKLLIIIFLITVFVSIIFFLITVRSVVFSIKKLINGIRDIESEFNLTKRIQIESKDEVGLLSRYFNSFIDNFHGIVKQVTSTTSTVASAASDLLSTSTSVSADTEKISIKASTVASATDQAASNTNAISSAAEEMSSSANSIAKAIEEMSKSLNEVNRKCQKELQIASEANMHAKSSKEVMDKFGEAAKSIWKIVEVINDIADQTNLLALNATIEAASAGDAGRGFTIVANEVKNLAKQTAKATMEIKKQIEEMKINTESAVSSIDSVSQVIEEVNSISQNIVDSIQEQSATVAEIAQNISGVSIGAQEVSRNVSESAKGLSDVAESISGVSNAVGNAVHGIAQVKERSDDLTRLSDSLNGLIGKFKI